MSSCGTKIVPQHKIPFTKKIFSSSFIYYRLMICCGTKNVLQHRNTILQQILISSSFMYYRLMSFCGTKIVLQHKIPQHEK